MTNRKPDNQLDTATISLIHSVITYLNTLIASHGQLLQLLEPDPFRETDGHECLSVGEILAPLLSRLEQALSKLIETIGGELSDRNIPESFWAKLNEFLTNTRACNSLGSALLPFRLGSLGGQVRFEIERLATMEPQPGIAREQKRELIVASKDIVRHVGLYNLHQLLRRAEWTKDQLLSHLISDSTSLATSEPLNVVEVVQSVVSECRDNANAREIDINEILKERQAKVFVQKTDFARSLLNLVDNAIKYTGELQEGSRYEKPWVDIIVDAGISNVYISVESWGVPVTQEELDGLFMFRAGYRGWFARRSGSSGTGIGLADVLEFVKRFGGNVLYDTVPRGKRASTSVKTTVTIVLPREVP